MANIGYHRLLVETAEPLQLHSKVKLAFTSVDGDTSNKIKLFVQMCLQGEVTSKASASRSARF